MNGSEYVTLTELAELFGVNSCRVPGRWLAELNLRRISGAPTDRAFSLNLVKKVPTGRGDASGYFWVWRKDVVIEILKKAGHEPLAQPSEPNVMAEAVSEFDSLCKPLTGPFDLQASGDGWQITNGDGAVIVWAMDSEVAQFVTRLLQLAYRYESRSLVVGGAT